MHVKSTTEEQTNHLEKLQEIREFYMKKILALNLVERADRRYEIVSKYFPVKKPAEASEGKRR
jgi:uncharacterized protein YktA (UPF0223 family)